MSGVAKSPIPKKLIGIRLRKLRKEMNIRQYEFADSLGVTPSCVANWESGVRMPNVNVVAKIAETLGVSVDYICCRSNRRNYPENDKTVSPDLRLDLSVLDEVARRRVVNYYDFLLKKSRKNSEYEN